MKLLLAGSLALAVLTFGGCAMMNRSEKGGEVSRVDQDFRISAPIMGTSVKQGEVQTVLVTLHRGEQFNQDVDIRVMTPEGLSIEPDTATIRSSDTSSVQLVITANKNAALVTHQVEVQATPTRGKATSVQFPVRVTAQ